MRPPILSDLFEQFAQGWRAYVMIAIIALAAALPGVGRMPVLDRDEARFTQATRQMLETGDFVRIKLQDDERNKKPIGIHWLQAAAVEAAQPLAPGLNNIWQYRIPSVLGAILAALACFWGGSALLSRRTAFVGAALFAGTILLGTEGMIAKTDAALAGFTTLAMAALCRLYAGKDGPKKLALLFWAALGVAALIKGPVAPLTAGLALLTIGLWERRCAWMKPLAWWPGPLLSALIVAPWMITIGVATEGRFFTEAIGEDLAPKIGGGQEGHFAWPGYHLALLPLLIFPATFALPAAARLMSRAFNAPRANADYGALRFLIAWAVPIFLLFEALPTKLAHYTLPALPAIALLCGEALRIGLKERWRVTAWGGIILFALAGATLVALVAASAIFLPGDADASFRRALQESFVSGGALILALGVLIFVPRDTARAIAAILVSLVVAFALRERVLPEARTLHVSVETEAALTRARLLPNAERRLWVVGYGEMSLVFLTRSDIRIAAPNVAGSEARDGDALVIEARGMNDTLEALSRRGLVYESIGAPVEGRNYGNGDEVRMFIGKVVRPEPPTEAP